MSALPPPHHVKDIQKIEEDLRFLTKWNNYLEHKTQKLKEANDKFEADEKARLERTYCPCKGMDPGRQCICKNKLHSKFGEKKIVKIVNDVITVVDHEEPTMQRGQKRKDESSSSFSSAVTPKAIRKALCSQTIRCATCGLPHPTSCRRA